MSTYYSVNDKRYKLWLSNAIAYRFQRLNLSKRDNNLWLFSAWEGQKFSDNSKYLFLYMNTYHPEIKCFWQTSNETVYNAMKKNKYPVQLIGTKDAKKTQKKAGIVLYTNGLDDFGDHPKIFGAKIVNLFHGVGFKKVYKSLNEAKPSIRKLLGDLKWDFFNYVKSDLCITTSEYMKEEYKKSFHIKNSSDILVVGQPRNDAFSKHYSLEQVLSKLDIVSELKNKKVILYMPTFRKNTTRYMQSIKQLVDSQRLQDVLRDTNTVLLCKFHYLNRGDLRSKENIVVLNDDDVLDVQKLIVYADYMLSDYSSGIVDFAITKKPTMFYLPSDDDFDVVSSMASEFATVCSINCAYEIDDCIDKITDMLNGTSDAAIRQSMKLNEIFDTTGIQPGLFCENVYQSVVDHFGVNLL